MVYIQKREDEELSGGLLLSSLLSVLIHSTAEDRIDFKDISLTSNKLPMPENSNVEQNHICDLPNVWSTN